MTVYSHNPNEPDVRGNVTVVSVYTLTQYNFEVAVPSERKGDNRRHSLSLMQRENVKNNINALDGKDGTEIVDITVGSYLVSVKAMVHPEMQLPLVQELTNAINRAIDEDYMFFGVIVEKEEERAN